MNTRLAHAPGHQATSELSTEELDLTSVGIDVGSATMQVLFSRVHLERQGRHLSSRYVVTYREVLAASEIAWTPYEDGLLIDADAVSAFVEASYQQAGFRPQDIDAGAVILTGEAIRRTNARAIADRLAASVGGFVCATAGHHLEATLAAHGSGAVALSRARGARILNIDVGGGTTKLTEIEGGSVVRTAAAHLGGRLVAFEGERIVRLEDRGREIAAQLGFDWHLGDRVPAEDLESVGEWMADALCSLLVDGHSGEAGLLTQDIVRDGERHFDAVVCSGGVSAYVYRPEIEDHGDLGGAFGRALRTRFDDGFPWPLEQQQDGSRATVIGASQYSIQVSGNTIYVQDPSLLPLHNVRVVRPPLRLGGRIDVEEVSSAIADRLGSLELPGADDPVALILPWQGAPSFERVAALAEAIERGTSGTVSERSTLCLVLEGDIGGTLGALLVERAVLGPRLVSIDGVTLSDLDFIDIGKVVEKTGSVPVTIKSLLFSL